MHEGLRTFTKETHIHLEVLENAKRIVKTNPDATLISYGRIELPFDNFYKVNTYLDLSKLSNSKTGATYGVSRGRPPSLLDFAK